MCRDFIYLDTRPPPVTHCPTTRRLVRAGNGGKNEEYSASARVTADFLSLLIPLNASATAGYKNATDLRQNKVLHDYAFNMALHLLRDQRFLLGNRLEPIPNNGFVL